jgi:hypothetical protein
MDEKEQMTFRGKFTVCVVLLNIAIFSAAVAICTWAIIDDSYWFKLPVVFAALIICVVAILIFVPRYKATKTWLQAHGTTKKERIAQAMKEKAEISTKIRAELEAEMRKEEVQNTKGDL